MVFLMVSLELGVLPALAGVACTLLLIPVQVGNALQPLGRVQGSLDSSCSTDPVSDCSGCCGKDPMSCHALCVWASPFGDLHPLGNSSCCVSSI